MIVIRDFLALDFDWVPQNTKEEIKMMHISRKARLRLLISAGTAMAASMAASGAVAADTVIGPGGAPATVSGHATIDAVLTNAADVTATISSATGGVGTEESPTGTTAIAVANNDILATALGNSFDLDIDHSAIMNLGVVDGAASLGYAVNTGAIGSTIEDSSIEVDLADFTSGSVANVDNTIAAQSTANSGTNNLAGSIPNTYASTEPGSSSIEFGGAGDVLNASGSLVASSMQVNIDPATTSLSDDNSITMDLISTGDNTIAASPELDRNTISASAEGNSSTNGVTVEAGANPTLEGSVVVTNGQINQATGPAEIVGENLNGTIFTTIEDDDLAQVNTLGGSLSVDDNSVSSSASGNEALGAAGGNSIVFEDGMSFAGAGTGPADTDIDYTGLGMDGTVAADAVIFNSQGNVGPNNTDRLAIDSITDTPVIGADVQNVDTGSVSVSGNGATSFARGNAATNAIETGSGSATWDATVAVANQQTNVYTDVSATTSDSDIGAAVVYAGTGDLTDSSVAVNGNTSSATGYGNQVSQAVAIEATSMALPDNNTRLEGGTGPVDGNIDTLGNITVASLQSVYSSDVTADNSGDVYLDTLADTVVDSTLEATGNVQEAVALGSTGANGLSVSGTSISNGNGVASVQIVADDSTISADDNSEARITALAVDGSSLGLTDNLQRGVAYGGSALNELELDTETLTVDAGGFGSTVLYDAGAADGFVLDNTTAPFVNSANGVLNVQSVGADGGISATAGQAQSFAVEADGAVTNGGTLTNEGNAVVAAAYGTDSTNSASLTAGNIDSLGGGFEDVLALANVQTVADPTAISAEASGGTVIDTLVTGVLTDSSVSTSANAVQALGFGNLADNDVTVDTTNIDTIATNERGEIDIIPATSAIVRASFSLNNVQSAAGTIDATLLEGGATATEIVTTIGDDVSNSSVASDDNSLTAGVTANAASNGLSIAGNSIGTTGVVASYQDMLADLSASIGVAGTPNEGGVLAVLDGSVEDSSVSVGGNVTTGSVTGNDASNSLAVSGTTVSAGNVMVISSAATDDTGLVDTDTDFAVGNVQTVGGSAIDSAVFGTFAIDMVDDETITDSTIAVDGNSQSASATANTGNSALSFSATNSDAGAVVARP